MINNFNNKQTNMKTIDTKKRYKGEVKKINISSLLNDLKIYTIYFNGGFIKAFSKSPLSIIKGDIVEFNCRLLGNIFIGSDIKRIKTTTTKKYTYKTRFINKMLNEVI